MEWAQDITSENKGYSSELVCLDAFMNDLKQANYSITLAFNTKVKKGRHPDSESSWWIKAEPFNFIAPNKTIHEHSEVIS